MRTSGRIVLAGFKDPKQAFDALAAMGKGMNIKYQDKSTIIFDNGTLMFIEPSSDMGLQGIYWIVTFTREVKL